MKKIFFIGLIIISSSSLLGMTVDDLSTDDLAVLRAVKRRGQSDEAALRDQLRAMTRFTQEEKAVIAFVAEDPPKKLEKVSEEAAARDQDGTEGMREDVLRDLTKGVAIDPHGDGHFVSISKQDLTPGCSSTFAAVSWTSLQAGWHVCCEVGGELWEEFYYTNPRHDEDKQKKD